MSTSPLPFADPDAAPAFACGAGAAVRWTTADFGCFGGSGRRAGRGSGADAAGADAAGAGLVRGGAEAARCVTTRAGGTAGTRGKTGRSEPPDPSAERVFVPAPAPGAIPSPYTERAERSAPGGPGIVPAAGAVAGVVAPTPGDTDAPNGAVARWTTATAGTAPGQLPEIGDIPGCTVAPPEPVTWLIRVSREFSARDAPFVARESGISCRAPPVADPVAAGEKAPFPPPLPRPPTPALSTERIIRAPTSGALTRDAGLNAAVDAVAR